MSIWRHTTLSVFELQGRYGETKGNNGTWCMTGEYYSCLKRVGSILRVSDYLLLVCVFDFPRRLVTAILISLVDT